MIVPERNTPAGCYAVDEYLRKNKFTRVEVIRETEDSDIGWWTSYATKTQYTMEGVEQMRENKTFFLDGMICVNEFVKNSRLVENTKEKLLEQLGRFRMREPPIGATRKKPLISGLFNEAGQKDKTLRDDLAMSFMIAVFFLHNLIKRKIPDVNYRRLGLLH